MTLIRPPFRHTPAAEASVTKVDNAVSSTDSNVYTFASRSFGDEASGRKLVIPVAAGGSGNTITGVTAGGNSCTKEVELVVASQNVVSIWSVELATGTSGDVVITHSGTSQRCGIGVFRVVGAAATAHATATASDLASPISLNSSITIPERGVCIAAAFSDTGGTWSWSGLSEDYDEDVADSNYHSGASLATAAVLASHSVTASGTGTNAPMCLVSWGPV